MRKLGILALAALLLLSACVTPIRYEEPADILDLLSPEALLYASVDGAVIRELVPSLLGEAEAASVKPILERTNKASLALLSKEGDFEAVLGGDYPFRAASLSLRRNKSWRKAGEGYTSDKLGLSVALPDSRLILASTAPVDGLVARLKARGSPLLPAGLEAMRGSDILVWAPEPFSRLFAAILGDKLDIPARGILIAAKKAPLKAEAQKAGNGESYEATIVMLMKDADSARIFKTAARLAWYGFARLALPEAAGVASPRFEVQGESVVANGISVSAKDFASLLGYVGSLSQKRASR